MTHHPGTRFGSYELVSPLGAGGMGEVYRARDLRLKRDVAIKILRADVARDADRLARFQREAEALAALNHPNIGAIYAVEGTALVLELVEGPTLADRIEQGAMTLDEVLPIVRQLTGALEYAHEKGIVHRDLKPANVKLTTDGSVKILDFGLAKALGSQPATTDPASSLALTIRATVAGTILGTPAYMAPEQARGQNVDKRADIWAFGAVVYEMLMGRALFDAPTVSDTLALVLTKDVELGSVPARLRPLLRQCLERDVRRRLRDIGDARMLIEEAPDADVRPRRSLLVAALAGLTAASTLAAVLAWRHFREPVPAPAPVRFEIAMPHKLTLGNGISVSPDGRQIAFTAEPAGGGARTIWVRQLGSLEVRPLAGTEWAGRFMAWSQDSRRLLWNTLGTVRRIDVAGGRPQAVCEGCTEMSSTGAWAPDGTILLTTSGGIVRVRENGGVPSPVVQGQSGRGLVHLLRDGRHFLYSRATIGQRYGEVFLGLVDSSAPPSDARRPLATVDGDSFVYAEDERKGYLLFQREGVLMAQRFDPTRLQLTGDPIPVADHVVSYGASAGVLAYRSGASASTISRLLWLNREGKQVGQVGPAGNYINLQLGPGSKTVIVDRPDATGTYQMWTGDIARGVFSRLTGGDGAEVCPAIAPDGRVAFSYSPSRSAKDIYITSESARTPEALVVSDNVKHSNHVSSDGRFLLYDEHNGAQHQDLWVVALDRPAGGLGKPIPFLTTPADESAGQFSPNSKWIAYASDESGKQEIYVRAFAPDLLPAAGPGKWLISTAGGDKPRWRPDGKELFYLAPDAKMMAVPVTITPGFEPGIPVPLFETRATGFLPYDVSAAGRFLINTPLDGGVEASGTITVVLNWTEGLKK